MAAGADNGDSAGKPAHVLVVDADPERASTVAGIVSELRGVSTECVASGREAIRRVAREPYPEAVVIALELPDFDGLEVADRIKRVDHSARVRTVVLATGERNGSVRRSLETNCDAYFVEPDPTAQGKIAAFAVNLLAA